MTPSSPIRPRNAIPAFEQGYVMLVAIFLMALLVLSLSIAAPQMARSIQRDRDLETFHRGMQYRRAIQLYYRKFHAYPPNVEALINTNEIRFLRKKYTDPITGQDDWKPIAFGQNKTPTAMGFFGQPLAGNASTLAGIGPGGAGLPGAQNNGGAFGSSPSGSGSLFGSSDSGSGQSPSAGAPGSTDNSGSASSGTTGSSGSAFSSSTPSSGTGSNSGSSSSSPTFGGAGIIGFEPASSKQSILIYKKKNHYNEWEFTYDPLSDVKAIGGGSTGLNGQPGAGQSGGGSGIGVGSGIGGGSGFGSGSGINPTPNPTPPETTPQ
jgi:type II secretory pathway pseudopilin PulG